MSTSAASLLVSLYGEKVAGGLHPRLQHIFDRSRAWVANQEPQTPKPLTEHDCMLITYADQVFESGVPPLRTLAEFAEQWLEGAVSGIHLLPFYPSSSDDGFAVADYLKVDPAYGTWDDLKRLGQRFDLMFDGVFNHLSAQSDWFRRFLAGDTQFRDFFVTVEGIPIFPKLFGREPYLYSPDFSRRPGRSMFGQHSARIRSI